MHRAIHPDPDGVALPAAPTPHRRGTQPSATRLRPLLQRPLDRRAERPPNARSAPTHPPRGGRVDTNFNLSQKRDAVQHRLAQSDGLRGGGRSPSPRIWIFFSKSSICMAWSPTLALRSWMKPSRWSGSRDWSRAYMAAMASSRHSASLPGVTPSSRLRASSGSPRKSRRTTSVLRQLDQRRRSEGWS